MLKKLLQQLLSSCTSNKFKEFKKNLKFLEYKGFKNNLEFLEFKELNANQIFQYEPSVNSLYQPHLLND